MEIMIIKPRVLILKSTMDMEIQKVITVVPNARTITIRLMMNLIRMTGSSCITPPVKQFPLDFGSSKMKMMIMCIPSQRIYLLEKIFGSYLHET